MTTFKYLLSFNLLSVSWESLFQFQSNFNHTLLLTQETGKLPSQLLNNVDFGIQLANMESLVNNKQ